MLVLEKFSRKALTWPRQGWDISCAAGRVLGTGRSAGRCRGRGGYLRRMSCLALEVLFRTISELSLLLSEMQVALGPPQVLDVAKSGSSL